MNIWNCDICGKQTFPKPETEPKFRQEGMKEVPDLDAKTGQPKVIYKNKAPVGIKMKEIPNMVPVMGKMLQQDTQTGEVKEIPVQEVEYKQTPTVIVSLRVGFNGVVKRDFCPDCLEQYCGAEIRALREKLISMESK